METVIKKYPKILIPKQYFDSLKKTGSVVPRYEKNGEVILFTVGKVYDIGTSYEKTTITAVCTQDCPCHLKALTNNPIGD